MKTLTMDNVKEMQYNDCLFTNVDGREMTIDRVSFSGEIKCTIDYEPVSFANIDAFNAELQNGWSLENEEEMTAEPTDLTPNFTVSPATYTTKDGRTLNMVSVKFNDNLDDMDRMNITEIARSMRGWFDYTSRSFFLRSESDVNDFTLRILGLRKCNIELYK